MVNSLRLKIFKLIIMQLLFEYNYAQKRTCKITPLQRG